MLKKALPACKALKPALSLLIFALPVITVAAQSSSSAGNSGTLSTTTSITSPSMPVISSPTMGSGFYMPGNSSNPIYSPASSAKKSQTDSSTSAETSKTESPASILSTLTASDVSSLDSMGLLSQLSSLTTGDSTLTDTTGTTLSNLFTSSSGSQTNLLLQQVLAQIEELKEENQKLSQQISSQSQEKSTVQNNEGSVNNTAARETVSQKDESKAPIILNADENSPHLLRFTVNGYNILSTCRQIYISHIQPNGSFLVTGDRRYLSDGVTRTETFHILFKPNEASNGISSYSTAAAVTQDWENQYSFLYQLSQKGELNASRTGNLVSLRTTDPEWKLELLIDLN